ncbi:NUDIX hydrolase [uncultured Jatrophihabitans sp.]|uniref:NUDIX hydrolase n=1 Tax=uncultured Jatrophihabitans sp. TaxID=1610747 RepID=UPI0035C9D1D1
MSSPVGDVPVRDAATVVLLRDAADGLDVWLLTRVTQMAFAAGMSVFPGGRVDVADADLPLRGADVPALAARLRCSPELAHALLGAALRETFEETGVLLTVPTRDLGERRAEVEGGSLPFGALLAEHELVLDAAVLAPWSRWITPAGETRRYDTRFFVCVLPAEAQARDVTTESSAAGWVSVAAAIEEAQRGERKLLPPTMATLTSLLPFRTAADVLTAAAQRSLEPVEPELLVGEDGVVSVRLPDGLTVTIPQP